MKTRKVKINNDIAIIPLTQGFNAIIDKEDLPLVENYNWHAHKDSHHVYASRKSKTIDGKRHSILMHRVIMNANPGEVVDHISPVDTLDNRKCNLRICTQAENIRNYTMPKTNSSGHKGVYFHKPTKKWMVQISLDNKRIFLGRFTNVKDAAEAYSAAALKYHGEFSRIA